MAEAFKLTIAEAASQIHRRELSPVELMVSLLGRAGSLESRLRVWVTLNGDAALAAARRSRDELTQRGPRGPLHGIPVGVKDIFYTQGIKTTAGSPIYADFVPTYDATTVALLKRAGAIIMGKTVTTEFACSDPPPTRNPWHQAHTPGGSSSGSAVGVSARIFPAALGTQTGGSVLRPAAYNGVVGLKPTFGRVSRHGVMPFAWSLDTVGIFARTTADAAIVLGALAGQDPKDVSSVSRPVPDYLGTIRSYRSPPRIGLARQFFYERSDFEVRKHVDEVVRRLTAAGAEVHEMILPADFDTLLAAHRVIMTVEAASVHEADFNARSEDYSPQIRSTVEAGMLTPAVTYVQAQRIRRKFREDMQEAVDRFDVLLTPSTPSAAPRNLSTTGDPAFQSPWTTCGFPALSLPTGLSEAGLPLGIQLVSAPFAEEKLLTAAHWCEQVLGTGPPPPVGM